MRLFIIITILFTGSFRIIPCSAAGNKVPPISFTVRNFPIQHIAGLSQILPLTGSGQGTATSFTITSVPSPTSTRGRLSLRTGPGTTVNVLAGDILTSAQVQNLLYTPPTTAITSDINVSFTYTVSEGGQINNGTFIIPVTVTSNVCQNGNLGTNILSAVGTFSSPFIVPNTSSCNSAIIGNTATANSLTTYTYAQGSGSLGPEGTYSFVTTFGTSGNCLKSDWRGSDHTGDNGYFMAYNGSDDANKKTFYEYTIAVCPNTLYEFSAWLKNLVNVGSSPDIRFKINGTTLAVSGALGWVDATTWTKFGGLWYSGQQTSVTLLIENNSTAANGNDLGLDDISMAICGPEITYPNIDYNPKYCEPGILPLSAMVTSSINTYAYYVFEESSDQGLTFHTISGGVGTPVYSASAGTYSYIAQHGDIIIDPQKNGYIYRLKVATNAANLVGVTCNLNASKIITVKAYAKPVLHVSDPPAVCIPVAVNLTAASVTTGSDSGLTFFYYTDAAGTQVMANPAAVSLSGTYYIKAVTAQACETGILPVQVNVLPKPGSPHISISQ